MIPGARQTDSRGFMLPIMVLVMLVILPLTMIFSVWLKKHSDKSFQSRVDTKSYYVQSGVSQRALATVGNTEFNDLPDSMSLRVRGDDGRIYVVTVTKEGL